MNIFIFGANWYNRGDESAIRAMIDELQIRYPDASIRIHYNHDVFEIPYEDIKIVLPLVRPTRKEEIKRVIYFIALFSMILKKYPNKENVERLNVITDSINWADVCVYAPGGPCIGDIYKIYEIPFMMRLMKDNGKPIFIYATSMGPFNLFRRYVKKALNKVDVICLRESKSQEYLGKLLPQKKSTVTLDSAFQHAIDSESNCELFNKNSALVSLFTRYDKVIGITVTDLQWNSKYKNSGISMRIKEAFDSMALYLKQNGYGALYIPQLFGKDNDKEYMESIALSDQMVLPDSYDCYFQQYIISRCYAVIGLRYHSNIFSAKMGVPFVSIAYEHKMSGFMKNNGLSQYCLDVNSLTSEKLTSLFEKVVEEYDDYASFLDRKKDEFKDNSYQTSRYLYELIDKIDKEK